MELSVNFTRGGLLGAGTYGSVYSGLVAGRPVAVKRHVGAAAAWPQAALRELVCMCGVENHPALMRLYFASSDARGRALLVFPRLGETLSARLARIAPSGLPAADVLKWSSQLLSGVAHLHRCGFAHRDIKLENMLLDDGNVILGDFGMARFMPSNQAHPPLTGNVCSLWTRPPELLLGGTPLYDERADAWSAGCVMLALAAGKYVIRGADGNNGPLPAIIALLGLPDGWQQLQGKRRDKPKNRDEQLHALRAACGGRADLPASFFDTLLQLLAVDSAARATVVSVTPAPWFREEPKQFALADTDIDFAPAGSIVRMRAEHDGFSALNSGREALGAALLRRIGTWVWATASELGMHATTALFALLCWLRFMAAETPPLGQEALFAAAACALLAKANEVKEVAPSTWAKACGARVRALQEAENRVLRALGGRLFTRHAPLASVPHVACAFALLIATDVSAEEAFMVAKEKRLGSEVWQAARRQVGIIARVAESEAEAYKAASAKAVTF